MADRIHSKQNPTTGIRAHKKWQKTLAPPFLLIPECSCAHLEAPAEMENRMTTVTTPFQVQQGRSGTEKPTENETLSISVQLPEAIQQWQIGTFLLVVRMNLWGGSNCIRQKHQLLLLLITQNHCCRQCWGFSTFIYLFIYLFHVGSMNGNKRFWQVGLIPSLSSIALEELL